MESEFFISTLKKQNSSSSISTMSIVQMSGVSASYDSKDRVLKDVTLNIHRGTNYAIVGASGSGKSTLLKLMNGMMTPSNGVVLYNYQKPSLKNKEFKKYISKIGYIPQTLGLVKNMSVMDNIMIGALPRISGVKSFFKMFPEDEIKNANDILKLVGLNGKSKRKKELNGKQNKNTYKNTYLKNNNKNNDCFMCPERPGLSNMVRKSCFVLFR